MKKQLLTTTALAGLFMMLPGGAFAACLPTPPSSGDNITCTGSDTDGILNNAADGVDVDVTPGATVNNAGGEGVNLGDNANINNVGSITGGFGDGITVRNNGTVTTLGSITGTSEGVEFGSNGDLTIETSGSVTGNTGAFFFGGAASADISGTITGTGGIAVDMTGTSSSTFTIHDGANINGTVSGSAGGSDAFHYDTGADVAFNTTRFTDKYLGFDSFDKDGAASLTLSGTTAKDWNVNAGNLIAQSDNVGDVDLDSGTLLRMDGTGTYTGDITGTGGFAKSGTGTLIFSGNNSYTGVTTVDGGGTLQIQDAGALSGTSRVDLNNSSVLLYGANMTSDRDITIGNNDGILSTDDTVTVSGSISGSLGRLVKDGTGDITLTGTNSYGAMLVNDGNLIGNADSLKGNAQLNGGALVFDQATTATYSGNVSGAGAFQKDGAGTLTLSGTNSYTGGTTVNAGALTGNANSLQGDIDNNAIVNFNQTTTGTYAGDMTGAGTWNVTGGSTLVLSGNNASFTGDLNVTNSEISAGAANNLGSGDISLNAARLITTGSYSFANNIDILGANTIFDTGANNNISTGIISGASNVVKVGAGSLALNGANTYVGDLMINEGAVIVSADTGFGDAANKIIIGDGTLQMGAAFTLTRDLTLTDVNSAVDTGGFDIEISGDIDGAGRIVKDGAGSLTLTGNNTFSGGIGIEGGSLIGTTTSINSDVTNNATLVFDQAGTGTYADDILGTGAVEFTGGATYTLTGANTYTGGTTVNSGTAIIGDTDSIFGDYTNNGDITIGGASGTYAGDMSGTGTLTIDSAGNTITLTGNNSYTGGTTVTTTTTLQGTTDALQGTIANSGTVAFSQSGAGTTNADIGGTGGVSFAGGGDFTLGGTNTYSGGTSIAAATSVTGDSDSIFGDYANDGTLTFDQSADGTYAGDITGTGELVKDGTEDLILTGTGNTYSGGTTISAGRLIGTTVTIQGDIINNADLRFNQSGGGLYGGDISGTGAVEFDGGATYTLTGANTYTGGTTVDSGTTILGDTNSIFGDYTNNGDVTIGGMTSGTYAGDMSGTGTLSIDAANRTITLTGTNTYTGGTTVTATSTMQGTTDAIQGDIANAGTVAFDQAGAGTYAGDISGAGDVTFDGGGDYTLSGTNTYTGGTTVASSTGITGDIDAIQGDITNDGDVTFTGADGTYAGDMTGTGALNIDMATSNTGLTLTGTGHTYSGGTHIIQGYLIGDTATLQGDITDDDTLAFDQTFDGTYAGDIDGTGQVVKAGTGNVTLTGTNSYTGGISIIAGTLTGNTDSLVGDVTNAGTIAFDQALAGTFAGDITGPGAFVKDGVGNLTLSGTNLYSGATTINAGTLTGTTSSINNNAAFDITNDASLVFDQATTGTFASDIVGTGDVTFDGGGAYTLTGTNTYTGGSTVTATTSIQGDLASIQGDIVNNGLVVIEETADGTYAGDMSGAGELQIDAANQEITLSGTNTYTGGTSVTNDTTVIGNADSIIGDYTNNGTVIFTDSGFGIYTGDMSGSGGLTMNGSGVLGLTGTNTYTGDTNVNSGYLAFDTTGSIASASDININDDAGLRFFDDFTLDNDIFLTGTGGIVDVVDKLAVLNGDISGTRLTVNGTGGLILSGINTYTDLVNNGVSIEGTTDSIVGDITNDGVLSFIQATTGTIAGDISGTGEIIFSGGGNYTLSGTNTYAGGTTIFAGNTVEGNANSLQGNISTDGTVFFNQASLGTYAGQLSGTGNLLKDGAGNLRLTGNNSGFTGDTDIDGGILSVNGDMSNSDVFVNASGTLGGNGTVGNVVVANLGTLGPGNSIDTLNVNGNLTFNAGSTYTVEFDNVPDHSDKVIATGDIIINGGSVFALGSGSSYAANTLYTILQGNTVTGTFDGGITTSLAFLDPTLIYNASTVQMNMARNDVLFSDVAADEYQAQVGEAVNSLGAGNDVFEAFTGLTAEQARSALDNLSSEHNAGAMSAIASSMSVLGNTISNHITGLVHANNENMLVASLAPNPDPGTYTAAYFEPTEDDPNWDNGYVWTQMLGGMGRAQARRVSPEQDRHSYGMIAGVDKPMDHGGWYGFFAGYEAGDMDTDSQFASSDISTYHVGTYITKPFKHDVNVTAGINVAYHDIDTERHIVMPGFDASPKGETEGTSVVAHVEVSKPYKVLDAAVEPFGKFTLTRTNINGYTEKEGGAANLTVGDNTNTNAATTIGLRMGRMVYMDGLAFKVNASVGWQHVFGDIESSVNSRFASGSSSFESLGTPQERDTAVIGLSVDGKLTERTNAVLGYQGILGKNTTDHAIKAGVKVKF